MKKYLSLALAGFIFGAGGVALACRMNDNDLEAYAPRNGDIILHTSTTAQSRAIQLATESPYSHVGIVYIKDGNPMVYEAVSTVRLTDLDEWTSRGSGEWYTVKRLKNADSILTDQALGDLLEEGEKYSGSGYDRMFRWSDTKMYCSELVWKIYHRALGVDVGELRRAGEFGSDNEYVQAVIADRWGSSFDKNEIIVSPADIDESNNLVTVFSNY